MLVMCFSVRMICCTVTILSGIGNDVTYKRFDISKLPLNEKHFNARKVLRHYRFYESHNKWYYALIANTFPVVILMFCFIPLQHLIAVEGHKFRTPTRVAWLNIEFQSLHLVRMLSSGLPSTFQPVSDITKPLSALPRASLICLNERQCRRLHTTYLLSTFFGLFGIAENRFLKGWCISLSIISDKRTRRLAKWIRTTKVAGQGVLWCC